MASIEEKVEEQYKDILKDLDVRHYGKTESINNTIAKNLERSKIKQYTMKGVKHE